MDRDPRENILDPVERVSPTTGENDTGTAEDDAARIHKDRQKRGTEPGHDEGSKAPEHDQAPGRQPN
jgi:hypothetical protein